MPYQMEIGRVRCERSERNVFKFKKEQSYVDKYVDMAAVEGGTSSMGTLSNGQ
jgi:hypothetical protein